MFNTTQRNAEMISIAEKEILPILESIARDLFEKRATSMETLAYVAYLCFLGTQGGGIGIEPDSPLDEAMHTIDSLWRLTLDDEFDVDYLSIERDRVFLHAPFAPDDYIEAFHIFLDNVSMFYSNYRDFDSFYSPKPGLEHTHIFNWDLACAMLGDHTGVVLDITPYFFETGYKFADFGRYIMRAEEKYLRSFLIIRKELEGESWDNVDIIGASPVTATLDGIILLIQDYGCPTVTFLGNLLSNLPVNEGAVFVCGHDNGFGDLSWFETEEKKDYPSRHRGDRYHPVDWFIFPGGTHLDFVYDINGCRFLVYGKESSCDHSVSFAIISIDQKWFEECVQRDFLNEIKQRLRVNECENAITVQKDDLRQGVLDPEFYLKRKRAKDAGTVSLYEICNFDAIRETRITYGETLKGLFVMNFEFDPRLPELTPQPDSFDWFDMYPAYSVKENAVLILTSFGESSPLSVSRVRVEPGSEVFLHGSIIPLVTDPDRYDPRFVELALRKLKKERWWYGFPAILDLIRIPDIPIEEQRNAVEEYLRGLRESLPGSAKDDGDSKAVSYNILVVTSDKEGFERRNGDKMKQTGLNVIGYASDSRSLEETIPMHFGKDVPVSRRVDAVLADITSPDGDTDFVLYRLHDLDVRKFYYSGSGDPSGRIHPIFREEILSGLIDGDDPASGMRRVLDTEMSPVAKIREEYKEFFQAAGRLDQLYPDWGLVDTVTGYLLAGKTKTPVNNVRSLLSETLCRFFRDRHAVPWCMDNGAIPSFLADGSYYDKNSRLQFKVMDGKTPKSEAWLRYAFVTLFKLGNKESHVSRETEEMVSEAALIILMQVIIWFDGVHDRYAEGKVGFRCFRKDRECAASVVREAAPGYFAVGDVHIGNQDGLRDGTVGILEEQLPPEKNPRTIDGVTYVRYADKDRFHILVP